MLVVEPSRDIVLDRIRLQKLKSGQLDAGMDDEIDEIVEAVDARGDVHGVILRARKADESGRWMFSDELDETEAAELAARLLYVHVTVFRRLARRGLFAFFSTDFSPRAVAAYARGSQQLMAELERKLVQATGLEAARIRLELWVLERHAAWSTRSFSSFIEDKLPTLMASAERQRKQLLRMLEALPDDV